MVEAVPKMDEAVNKQEPATEDIERTQIHEKIKNKLVSPFINQ